VLPAGRAATDSQIFFSPWGNASCRGGRALTLSRLRASGGGRADPYLTAIPAIVDSGFEPARQLALLLVNGCFVLPLILIVLILALAGDRAQRFSAAFANDWTEAGRARLRAWR
jgi:hypothetical protein